MIKVGDDYQITTDKYQFILSTRSKTEHEKAKSDYVWNKTFHASIEQAAKAIADKEIKNGLSNDLLDIKQLKVSFEMAIADLTKAIQLIN